MKTISFVKKLLLPLVGLLLLLNYACSKTGAEEPIIESYGLLNAGVDDANIRITDCNGLLFSETLTRSTPEKLSNFINNVTKDKDKLADCMRLITGQMQDKLILQARNFVQSSMSTDINSEPIKTSFDILLVGAGIHSAIFALNAFGQRILVVDKGSEVSPQFYSTEYFINSPSNLRTNPFPGAPIQLHEHALLSNVDLFIPQYATAMSLWNQVVLASFYGPANYLFNRNIESIEEKYFKDIRLYKVKISGFSEPIYVKKVVFATGLGECKAVPLEPSSFVAQQKQAIEHCSKNLCEETEIPNVMTFNQFLQISQVLADFPKFHSISGALAGKEVAIVGSGDSSSVAMEMVCAANTTPPFGNQFQPKEDIKGADINNCPNLLWIGQKASNFAEYRASFNQSPRVMRYANTKKLSLFEELFGSNPKRLKTYPSQLTKIEKHKNRIILHLDDGQRVESDYVVLALGYDYKVAELLKPFTAPYDATNIDTATRILRQNEGTTIGRQLCAPDKKSCYEIYFIGAAATPLASKGELAQTITKNEWSIQALVPITVRLACYLSRD